MPHNEGYDMHHWFLLCCIISAMLVSTPGHTVDSLSPSRRIEIFSQIWKKVDRWYPYFNEKHVNWDSVRTLYAPRVASAASDQHFFTLMAAMLRDLHDGHTAVLSYPGPPGQSSGMPALRLVDADGRVLVVRAEPESQAATAGIEPGMELLGIDGTPVEEMIARNMPRYTASTVTYARWLAVTHLLQGPLTEAITLEFRGGITCRLDRQFYAPVDYDGAVSARRLTGDIGYLRLPTFAGGAEQLHEIDRTLESLRYTRALIIDIRGNPGGSTRYAAKIAGRFFRDHTIFTTFTRTEYLLGIPVKIPAMLFPVTPRGRWHYLRPIALLVDPMVFSAAEYFAAGMKDTGRATLFGQTTAGASGNPKEFTAGPLRYRVSTWREYRLNGRLIEGIGIEPTCSVSPTPDDLRAGRDAVLLAAAAFLAETARKSTN